jgi:hypothetical protein
MYSWEYLSLYGSKITEESGQFSKQDNYIILFCTAPRPVVGLIQPLALDSIFSINFLISNHNYFRFYKLICYDSIHDLKRLIQ